MVAVSHTAMLTSALLLILVFLMGICITIQVLLLGAIMIALIMLTMAFYPLGEVEIGESIEIDSILV